MNVCFKSLLAIAAATLPTIANAAALEVVSAQVADGVTIEQMRAVDPPVWKAVAAMPGFI